MWHIHSTATLNYCSEENLAALSRKPASETLRILKLSQCFLYKSEVLTGVRVSDMAL
jgi:hypothetical protein